MAAVVGGTNTLLYDTDNATSSTVASDMTGWSMIMCFSPVETSINFIILMFYFIFIQSSVSRHHESITARTV